MRLSAAVPLLTVAANTDTSMKYIQEHYFPYKADEGSVIGKIKRLTQGSGNLSAVLDSSSYMFN